jgi:thioesterase domain-containing protein
MSPNQPFIAIGIGPEIVEELKAPYRMEEIAAQLVSALRKKQPRGPYRLGGYCLSAVFAFEIARQLTLLGEDVGLLVLFEPRNPRQPAAIRITTGLRRMFIRAGFRLGELRRLGKAEFPVYARRRWKGFKSVLKDMVWGISARSGILNTQLRSTELDKILFFAASSYEPKPLACPTVIFRSRDCPILAAGDPYFGWRELLTGHLETHELSGDHVGIFRDTNGRMLAEKLGGRLKNEKQPGTHSDEQIVNGPRAQSLHS